MEFHRPRLESRRRCDLGLPDAPAFAATSGKCDGAGCTPGIRLHVQVDEQRSRTSTKTALFPCTGPEGGNDADFDTTKAAKFGTTTERASASMLNAKRLAFHYGHSVHNQSPTPPSTSISSTCS